MAAGNPPALLLKADIPEPDQLQRRVAKQPRRKGAGLASELERGVLAFIAERHGDRHLDIETAQRGRAAW